MSDTKKPQSQAEVRDLQLGAYYKGRAQHFLDNLIVPLIRRECKAPTQDVSSTPEMQYLLGAVLGSEAQVRSSKINLPN